MHMFTRTGLAAAFALSVQFTAAVAAPYQVTLHPSDVGLGTAPNSFLADSLGLRDYAVVNITGTTSDGKATFSESGFLNVTGFSLNGTSVNPPGLATGGAGSYSLYFAFSGTGVQDNADLSMVSTGKFTTLHFDLFGGNGIANFTYSGGTYGVSGLTDVKTLASGDVLNAAQTFVTYFPSPNGISTSAQNIMTSFGIAPGGVGFVTPADVVLNLSSAFTNDAGVAQLRSSTSFSIDGGGGSASFIAVPEPASLAILGTGMILVGWKRRQRA